MDKLGVIDTETTWSDRVMSIGAVIAEAYYMRPLKTKYYRSQNILQSGCTRPRLAISAQANR